jgi:hypothetical protein
VLPHSRIKNKGFVRFDPSTKNKTNKQKNQNEMFRKIGVFNCISLVEGSQYKIYIDIKISMGVCNYNKN